MSNLPETIEQLSADEALMHIESQPQSEWPRLVSHWAQGDEAAASELLQLLALGHDRRMPQQQAGEVLGGRYQLLAPVGQGVTGTVWRARDAKLERDVAVKIFDAEPDRILLARALQEARAAADVVSEHVLRVYDVVEPGAQGPAFIVTELIQEYGADGRPQLGVDLSTLVPRSLHEALRWAADAAWGLSAAHTRAVFQRDVKLQNMLLTPVTRRVKVVDFGLATHQLNDSIEPTNGHYSVTLIRHDGATIAGTPSCMAPEAARGLRVDASTEEGRHVLAAVDVFGVGAALYELLTGRRLYESKERGPAALTAVLEQAAKGPPLPLAWGRARFKIPSRIRRIVEKALAPEPLQRYRSVETLASDLEASLASRPTSFERHSSLSRLWLWNRRLHHLPAAVVFSTLTFVGVATGAAAISQDLTRTTSELSHRRAELTAANAELVDFRKQLTELRSHATSAEKAAMMARQQKERAVADLKKAEEVAAEAELARGAALAAQTSAETERDESRSQQKTLEKERDDARAARRQAEKERDDAKALRRQAERERDDLKTALTELQREATETETAAPAGDAPGATPQAPAAVGEPTLSPSLPRTEGAL